VKPAPFAYDAPPSLDAALAVLAQHGDEATVLAGGQSLVPLLNFRLARPALVVDINRLEELAYLRRPNHALRIGALTRMRTLEHSELVASRWPVLGEAARFVGHPQIRSRGTVGGSVAHADPAAELPVVLTALDARFHLRSARGARVVGARELFVTYLTTSIQPDELLVEIEVPPVRPGTGAAFVEHARVHGDFALAGAAAVVVLDPTGACADASIALLGAAPVPARATRAEDVLVGARLDDESVREAAAEAVRDVEPAGDVRYRRALLEELVRRTLVTARERGAA
jgi:CO/xanthine dehydrogenase FAD-binding subunit